MKITSKILACALVAGSLAMSMTSAKAILFTNGDLILGFQATGGTGATKNVFFNLGSGVSHRNNGNLGLLGNINTDLESAYGVGWFSRTDLYFGVIGNLNANPNTGIGSAAAVNGDPSRTVYLSRPATTPGTGLLIAAGTYPSASLGSAGNNISGLEGILSGITATSSGAGILDQTNSPVEWNNGWTAWNPTPGAAFGVITGGIQTNLGAGGSYRYVDVQRVLSTNTGASPTGTIGGGTYETSIAIGSTGSITATTAAIPEPSTYALLGISLVAAAIVARRRKVDTNA